MTYNFNIIILYIYLFLLCFPMIVGCGFSSSPVLSTSFNQFFHLKIIWLSDCFQQSDSTEGYKKVIYLFGELLFHLNYSENLAVPFCRSSTSKRITTVHQISQYILQKQLALLWFNLLTVISVYFV